MLSFCRTLGVDYAMVSEAVSRDLGKLLGVPSAFYTIVPVTRGASNRGYCRLHLSTLPGSPIPSSIILMVLSDPDPHKGVEEIMRFAGELDELPFINVLEHLRAAGVAVPELYHYNQKAGLLYIEDFGSVMLRDAITGKPEAERQRHMEAAIDELVKLQVRGTRRENPRFLGFRVSFDRELLYWELNHFTDYAIRDRLPGKLDKADERRIEGYFNSIVDSLLAAPYILTHRDYMLDNLLVQDGRIKVIDFQDALMGPLPYDLACLLYDRDTADILGKDLIERLVEYYAGRYGGESKEQVDRQQFRRRFDLCVLHRAFKVVGRFFYIKSVKKRDEFLKWIPPMCRALREYLDRCPETRGMRKLLLRYLPELAD